jgi:hypothetical protein
LQNSEPPDLLLIGNGAAATLVAVTCPLVLSVVVVGVNVGPDR